MFVCQKLKSLTDGQVGFFPSYEVAIAQLSPSTILTVSS